MWLYNPFKIAAEFRVYNTINQHKLVPPTQQLVLCSIQLDTIVCSMTLPQEKLLDLQVLVSSFQSKDLLQRLVGKLNWGCRVVNEGGTFLC